MSVNPSIFKAYDVRGLYPSEVNEDAARLIGRAYVSYLDAKRVAVGRDMRLSSPSVAAAFIKGARRQLCLYDLKVSDTAMVKLLNERARAGVEVRIIGGMKGAADGVRVCKPGIRLHVRAIIRDGLRAFVGSQSLRKDELTSRREVGLLVNNPAVAKKLLQVFDADWRDWATEPAVEPEKMPVEATG